MKQSLGLTAVVVRDYDEAIDFYTNALDFVLVDDSFVPEQNKRWVVVAPPGATESRILLARAVGEEQVSRVGNQTDCLVSGVLFTLVAFAHLLRIVYGMSIVVDDVAVPMLVSWIGLFIPAILAVWAFRISRGSSTA